MNELNDDEMILPLIVSLPLTEDVTMFLDDYMINFDISNPKNLVPLGHPETYTITLSNVVCIIKKIYKENGIYKAELKLVTDFIKGLKKIGVIFSLKCSFSGTVTSIPYYENKFVFFKEDLFYKFDLQSIIFYLE